MTASESLPSLPTTPIERDPDKLNEILPWYLNGSLSESDSAWVQDQLASAGAPVAAARNFDESIAGALRERAAEIPADVGWQQLIGRVRSESAPSVPAVESKRGFLDIIASLFSPRLGMALAAVLAVQTVAIGYLVNDRNAAPEYSEYRSVGGATQVPVLRVTFAENVNEQQLRDVLFANEVSIIGGPNQLGEFFLRSEQADLADLAGKLKSSGLVVRSSLDHKVIAK